MPDWIDRLVERHPDLFEIVFDGRVHRPGLPAVGDGWHHTACDRHGRGRKVPIRPGHEGLRQVWRADGPPRWVRYDRDADAFVEVEAPSAS